jgi:PTH1 family peptidyl-tRNA hydrolase
VVLGLGNPGPRYGPTRHNVGLRVLDRLAERARTPFHGIDALAREAIVAEITGFGAPAVLAKSGGYMNHSGRAALALVHHYGIPIADLWVVHDDADLELGRLRLRPGGGAGGHNGVRSVMDALESTAFGRVRVGVSGAGRSAMDLADYVLEPFEPAEEVTLRALVEWAADAVEIGLTHGLAVAMERCNGIRVDSDPGLSEPRT